MANAQQTGVPSRPLEGKIGLVTGASRGIGAAICENLARKGCSLIMNYTSQSSAPKTEDLAKSLREKHNVRTCVVQADCGKPDCGQVLLEAAKKELAPPGGELKMHIIVNNAGIAENQTISRVTTESFYNHYNVNVLGPLLIMQAFKNHLPTDRSGRVVNVSSVSASLGYLGQSIYGGTKAALEAMTRTWARELSGRCTVNAVNPGPVATDMYAANGPIFFEKVRPWNTVTPRAEVSKELDGEEAVRDVQERTGGRAATSEEIAGIVGMLCSEEATWCTGSVVCANGGMIFGR